MDSKDFDKNIMNTLASISHEMSTPVNLIASTAKLVNLKIDKTKDIESIKEYMNNIINNCNKISMLISNMTNIDLAAVSKREFIEAKHFFETFCYNINPYCTELGVELEKNIKIEREYIDLPIDTVERILLNLITNAIKYNDKKQKKVKISMIVKEDMVIFSVKDNGIGISEENISKVTEQFFRVDRTIAAGMGLGLPLVKKYLENMGGNLEIKSRIKKGTEIIISVPITPEDKIFTAGEKNYVYNPEASSFDIEFSQLKNSN